MVIHVIQTYRETRYKMEKLFDIWRHFQGLRVFHFLNEKIYFCSHILNPGRGDLRYKDLRYISPKVPNIAEYANITEFFCQIRWYWAPCIKFFIKFILHLHFELVHLRWRPVRRLLSQVSCQNFRDQVFPFVFLESPFLVHVPKLLSLLFFLFFLRLLKSFWAQKNWNKKNHEN